MTLLQLLLTIFSAWLKTTFFMKLSLTPLSFQHPYILFLFAAVINYQNLVA